MFKSYFYLTVTSSERSYAYVMSNGKCKLLNCAIITLCHVLVKLELTFGDDLDMFNVNILVKMIQVKILIECMTYYYMVGLPIEIHRHLIYTILNGEYIYGDKTIEV
jgi:hypothetical protein